MDKTHLPSAHVISPPIKAGRLRLLFRWARFGLQSLLHGDLDFLANAINGSVRLILKTPLEFSRKVECNICGWRGHSFYPNVGSGYFELSTTCPRCLCQDRHRTLAVVLEKKTRFFDPGTRVVEVAPMRSFQDFCLMRKANSNYISFDFERFAMEQGDITDMRYGDRSVDYFLCFHVLEHIPEEQQALKEIRRVLDSSGEAILQVPIDLSVEHSFEYDKPDRRETNHVRRYGRDFPSIIERSGFSVTKVCIEELVTADLIRRHGLSTDPIYLAKKVDP